MVSGKHCFAWIALAAVLFFCGCAAKKQIFYPEPIAYQQGAQETAKEFKDTYAGGLYYQKPLVGEVDIPAGYISGGVLRLPGKEWVVYRDGEWLYRVNPETAVSGQKKTEEEDAKKQYCSYHSGPVANPASQYSIPEERPAADATNDSSGAVK